MKKAMSLNALPALLINADPKVTKVQYPLAAFEIDGRFYACLSNNLSGVIKGVNIWVRAHGPRMGELYGVAGSLNMLGLHVIPSRELTRSEQNKIEAHLTFYLRHVTITRTVKTEGKARQELRSRTEYIKVTPEYSVALIKQFVVAFGQVK